jgi:hypothetical protein
LRYHASSARQLAFEEGDQIVLVTDQALAALLRLDTQRFLQHALIRPHEVRGCSCASGNCSMHCSTSGILAVACARST